MAESQPHEMHMVRTHASGAEEWHCPTCGRRFLMHWPPTYKKIVLAAGDEYAAHVGGKSSVHTHSDADIAGAEQEQDDLFAHAMAPLPAEEIGPIPLTNELRPWLRWMNAAGLADEPGAV